MHGPALKEDDPGQLYDNWGGVASVPTDLESDISDIESSDGDSASDLDDDKWEGRRTAEHQKDDEDVQHDSDAPFITVPELLVPNADGEAIEAETSRYAPDTTLFAQEESDLWWPWPDQATCLLDCTGAFPRSLFSENEMRGVKKARERVLQVAGTSPKLHEGQCGHVYATADLPDIIRHEFANPLVRSKLELYPEDGGNELKHPRQGRKWREEVDPNLAAPMARTAEGKDFFVHELALASIDTLGHVAPIVPTRWFHRNGQLMSKALRVKLGTFNGSQRFIVDARVEQNIEVPLTAYLLNVEDLLDDEVQRQWSLPAPDQVHGKHKDAARRPPLLTNVLGVLMDADPCAPLEAWNHPLLYHIHFLSTSNLASPLEMMEEITAVLREAAANGLIVWDCMYNEDILVIPWVLAFQGDNPMASEFASHIGMKAKYPCRVCHMRADNADRSPGVAGEKERLKEFMTSGRPRTKAEALEALAKQEARAFEGAPSAVDHMATETGTKDKYLQHFLDKLQAKLTHAVPPPTRAARLAEFMQQVRNQMPECLVNPVLKLDAFEPNVDTPFEALHNVLLGVVKYWWRDACARQDQRGKATLIARLSSADVAGLGISPLRGHTLVHYAGSLVGRDFRVILQVAPSVLYGLLPQAAYEAWLALCRLAPLIFQPQITSREVYEERLTFAIDDFLAATALWSIRWFNKTKFHLFVHLREHIEHFGPAILAATESFESFNLVIRLRSVNSNKHAPSLDISRSFSHLHAVRHLVSGGFVSIDENGTPIPHRQAGKGVRQLIQDREFLDLMTMSRLFPETRARCYRPLDHHNPWRNADTTKLGCSQLEAARSLPPTIVLCKSIVLTNEDIVSIGSYVAYYTGDCRNSLMVGRVEEIEVDPSPEGVWPDGILLSRCTIGEVVLPYRMPACRAVDEQEFIPLAVRLSAACAQFSAKMES
ncbi:hypothetical protein BN946_scf184798.g56 [Trametes cinnabarina]|uniref:Uncharacterized protein n=1 Tax=Pycnoporus cinnabarinus TaxID=5643 RepID=A0A060S921_PYCCI|nr:hypothetical protein BN946_scf184798.g56 [Trametes cinnabarina]